MSRIDPTCQDGCNVRPPDLSFTDCDPEVHEGEIDRLYFMSLGGAPLTNVDSLAEWNSRLSNTSTSINAIRFMNVVGEKPVAEGEVIKISRNRKITMHKAHTINFDVDETNQENYDALRELECGGNFLWWYQTAGGLLYGGTDGIEAYVNLNDMIPKDRAELNIFQGVLTWDAEFHPERTTNPMA